MGVYNKYFGFSSGYENGKDYVKIVGIMISYEDSNIIFLVEVSVFVLFGLMVVVFVFMWNCCRICK